MRYGESFLLGVLIAGTALILQVFVSFFMEIFFHQSLALTTTTTLMSTLIFFLITAMIEEFLRYAVIKKRIITYTDRTLTSIVLHGIALGSGFWFIELFLGLTKNATILELPLSLFAVLSIHVIASICLITIAQRNKIIFDIYGMLCVIIFHMCSNVFLFFALL